MIGPGPELELLGLLVVDREAGHVGRQQVRRELDPPEDAAEAPRDRLGEDGLAGARHVLDQQVAAAQERDEGEADLVVLADDDALDVGEDLVAGLLDVVIGLPSTGAAPAAVPSGDRRFGRPSGGRARRVGTRATSVPHCRSGTTGASHGFSASSWASARRRWSACSLVSRGAGSARRPTATISAPMAPITPRNGSPPSQAATATTAEQRGQHERDGRQAEALDQRPRLAGRRAGGPASVGRVGRAAGCGARAVVAEPIGAPASATAARRARSSVPSGRRRAAPPAPRPGRRARRGPRSRSVGCSTGAKPMNHECGSPRAAELGRAGLAGGRHARDLRPGGELAPEVALDRLLHRRRGSPRASAPARTRRQRPTGRSSASRPSPVIAVTRCGFISTPSFATVARHERHLERASRTSRPGRTTRSRARRRRRTRRAPPPSPFVTCDDRGRQVERDRRAEAHPRGDVDEACRRRSRSPASAYQMLQRHLGRAGEVERRVAGRRVVAVADPEAARRAGRPSRRPAAPGTSSRASTGR